MRTKANKARNIAKRARLDDDSAFANLMEQRMREQAQAQGGYDPDSFTHWFEQFGVSDTGMERETAAQMRPKFAAWLRARPDERRKSRRRSYPRR